MRVYGLVYVYLCPFSRSQQSKLFCIPAGKYYSPPGPPTYRRRTKEWSQDNYFLFMRNCHKCFYCHFSFKVYFFGLIDRTAKAVTGNRLRERERERERGSDTQQRAPGRDSSVHGTPALPTDLIISQHKSAGLPFQRIFRHCSRNVKYINI